MAPSSCFGNFLAHLYSAPVIPVSVSVGAFMAHDCISKQENITSIAPLLFLAHMAQIADAGGRCPACSACQRTALYRPALKGIVLGFNLLSGQCLQRARLELGERQRDDTGA